ncbi:MAG TPA: N-acetyl-gamma-glutamyl-phosphate reductase [Streptosporangiaceae bacterium]|nr:N-acetyl-gamma-glutamyl-phosphate reductase [Streptosporangiaceae bacterium]
MITAGVVGGSGFTGGELIRLLLGHPDVTVSGVTSVSHIGRPVHYRQPHLYGLSDLRYRDVGELPDSDAIFLATPPGAAVALMPRLAAKAPVIIDLSPDARITDPRAYEKYYGPHPAWDLTSGFVSGLPELHRAELRTADRISVPGCMATAAILALYPPATRGFITGEVWLTGLSGSSGSGAAPSAVNVHSIRSGAMRVYSAVGHRHEAEITQAVGLPAHMAAIGVEAVRGVQVVGQARTTPDVTARDLRDAYRKQYVQEPFVRLIRRRGIYPLPEPKILIGSNFCDIGFEFDEQAGRLAVIAALDNLVKGAAGNAVQCLNIRMGLPEDRGLTFPGLHPV